MGRDEGSGLLASRPDAGRPGRLRTHLTATALFRTLADDIIPFVDRTYRTAPDDRCLYGYSQAGFFVLYALFNRPGLFQRHLSGSGVSRPQSSYLCEMARPVFDRYQGPTIQLYVSVGELENESMTDFREFTDILSNLDRPHLELTVEVYPNVGHDPEAIALTYLHGLRSVYSRQSVADSASR